MDYSRLSAAIVRLAKMMERLRGPAGCPWDAQQTASTVKVYLLEEAYEVLEAVERAGPREVCSELGDLLFQIVFLSQLAAEKQEFDLADVMERIGDKMVRRHPHVFGDAEVADAEEVARNWARIKDQEKGGNEVSPLTGVPRSLPALMGAHRLSERCIEAGSESKQNSDPWAVVAHRFQELRAAANRNKEADLAKALGDLMFALADLARERGYNAENLLRETNDRFRDQFEETEPSDA